MVWLRAGEDFVVVALLVVVVVVTSGMGLSRGKRPSDTQNPPGDEQTITSSLNVASSPEYRMH